jgi:hypothetical protein
LKYKKEKEPEFANSFWGTGVGQTILGLAVKYTSEKQYKSYGLFSTLKVHAQDDPKSAYLTFVGAAGRWHYIERLSKNVTEKDIKQQASEGFQIGNIVIKWKDEDSKAQQQPKK